MGPSPALHYGLGILLEKAGRKDEALQQLEAARAGAAPEVLKEIDTHRGYVFASQRRFNEARDAFKHALEAEASGAAAPELNAAMARVCIELHDYQAALPYLERAHTPQNALEILRLTALAQVQRVTWMRAPLCTRN